MMYTVVKFSGFDAFLERITVGFFDKFSYFYDFFKNPTDTPPPSKAKKTRQGGGVSVANAWDRSAVEDS